MVDTNASWSYAEVQSRVSFYQNPLFGYNGLRYSMEYAFIALNVRHCVFINVLSFKSVIQMNEKRGWMTNMLNIDILLSTSSLYLAGDDIH